MQYPVLYMILDTKGGLNMPATLREAAIVGGAKMNLTNLPTSSLQLDPQNPRIRYTAEIKGLNPKTNKEIRQLLLQDDDIRQLLADIKRVGYIHDPILVNKDGTIIEGNSRAACYMELLERDGKSGRWNSIPANVLLEQMPPDEVAVLQAYYHVRMKNKWATYAKAAHIYELIKTHGKTVDQIRVALNMQAKTVEDMMRAYETMKKHSFDKEAKKDPEKTIRTFSGVLEFEKRPDLAEFREKESDRKKFIGWIKDGKFDRLEDVRKLGPTLRNPKARAAFEKGGMSAAKPILRKTAPSAELRQYSLVGRITAHFNKRFTQEVNLIRENDACTRMLKDLVGTIEKVLAAAKKR